MTLVLMAPPAPRHTGLTVGTYTPTTNVTSEGRFTDGKAKVGAGSYTPVTNSGSGSNGGYVSSTGFWFSVPTTAVKTGTGYVSGSKAVSEGGCAFQHPGDRGRPDYLQLEVGSQQYSLQQSAQKWTKALQRPYV